MFVSHSLLKPQIASTSYQSLNSNSSPIEQKQSIFRAPLTDDTLDIHTKQATQPRFSGYDSDSEDERFYTNIYPRDSKRLSDLPDTLVQRHTWDVVDLDATGQKYLRQRLEHAEKLRQWERATYSSRGARPTTPDVENMSPVLRQRVAHETIPNPFKEPLERMIQFLDEFKEGYDNAGEHSRISLEDNQLEAFNSMFEVPIEEVSKKHFQMLKHSEKLNGFYTALRHSVEVPSAAVEFLKNRYRKKLNICTAPGADKDKVAQALKTLHFQEKEITGNVVSSAQVYPEKFKDSNEKVKLEALRGMLANPDLRPSKPEFQNILEQSVLSNDIKLKTLGIHGLSIFPFESRIVNNEIERILKKELTDREYREEGEQYQLYSSAINTKLALLSLGHFSQIAPKELGEALANKYFPSHNTQKKISTVLENYQSHSNQNGPNSQMYLLGGNSETKKNFAKELSYKVFGSDNFVLIDFSKVKNVSNVEEVLQQSGVLDQKTHKVSLKDKLVMLDHFDELENFSDQHEAAQIRDFFKSVFEKGSLDRFDFNHSILVTSSTRHLPETKLFGASEAGRACYSRLKSNSQLLQLN